MLYQYKVMWREEAVDLIYIKSLNQENRNFEILNDLKKFLKDF